MGKMEKAPGRITTFYSYKGGTGRSMALANFAWILAANGKHVLAIDWDLEAPGLHRYFRPFLVDPDLFETDGLIDTFWNFAASALADTSSKEKRVVTQDSIEVAEALEDATRRLDWKFPAGGYIDFIGAGRQGTTYSDRVNSFDWRRFYELGGARVLTSAKVYLRGIYDWILIDSRTGVSDTSGICTMQMPEVLVACFTLNRQSIDGVAAILRSIRSFRSASVDGSKIEFFPVATRIENAEQGRLEAARGYARANLADFLPGTMSHPREYWDKMEISYRPAYAFEEILSAFGDATGATGAADTMLSQVEEMAQCITGDSTLRMPEIVEADRASVLAKYTFGNLSASETKPIDTVDDALDTGFLRGVRAKEQVWRTSKFWWRYLLSRREIDLLTDADRKEFGRNMTFYLIQSERMQRLLRTIQLGRYVTTGMVLLALFITAIIGSTPFGEIIFGKDFIYRDPLTVVQYFMIAIYFLGLISVLVWSAAAARDTPYGVKLSQVLLMWVRVSTIIDYEAMGRGE